MNAPLDVIIEALGPVIGEHMARSVVAGYVERMGVTAATITQTHLGKLLRDLGLGLNVFVGRAAAKKLVDDLAHKLAVTLPT